MLTTAVAFTSISFPAAAAPADAQAMAKAAVSEAGAREINLNKDWKFNLGDMTGAEQASYDDSQWQQISLPHDFSIIQEFSNSYEAESGFLPGGTGWYRKTVVFPESYDAENIVLNFDGVYNHAYVYVNGTKVGEHHYGYTNFAFDISDLLVCDGETKNVIAVKAVNQFPSSRWYSGSGIYRDVTLTVTDPVHVAMDGTYVTTPDLEEQQDGDVTVQVETIVRNDSAEAVDASVRTTILDDQDQPVSDPVTEIVSVDAEAEAALTQAPTVYQPELWDCENPKLYYVKTEVLVGEELKDTYTTEFGFRYIEYDANEGFLLNGKNVKLKGVCMHHDQGALGAAAYYDAMYRQVEILKEMGCNAIRTSHNPASEEFISICNKEGILVMEEVFDGWSAAKNGNYNDFSTHFNQTLAEDNQLLGKKDGETWAQFTLEATVNRDKNAPSVIMWSIGNELPTGTAGGTGNFANIADDLIAWLQAVDDTKPITMGDNQYSWSSSDFRTTIDRKLIAAGGVVGLNYYPATYSSKHSQQPTWPLVATETASVSNSRGIYTTTTQYSRTGDYQCTAYDTNCVSWGNKARESWYYTVINDFIAGEFVWTGFDYIGEPTPWNGTGTGSVSGDQLAVPNSSYFGIIDTAGFPKDSYYYYTSQWREDATTLHLVPQSWNEEELTITNGQVPVYIYSNAAKVELYLNGELIGTSTRTSRTTNAGYEYGTYANISDNTQVCSAVSASGWDAMAARFNVKYAEGTLSTKAYDADGNLIEDTLGLASVTTNSDSGSYLSVTPEKTQIQADGSSLCYISVDVMDSEGSLVSAADNNIRFNLMGNGTIVGVDNGNPSTIDKFQQESVLTSETTANIDAFSGKALVIVRSTEGAGGFTLKATSAGLSGQTVSVDTLGEGEALPYVQDYELQTNYEVEMGTIPVLQTEVTGVMSDGTEVTGTVTWDESAQNVYDTPGDYTVEGTLYIADQAIPVAAYLHVEAKIAAVRNYSRATSEGVVPQLPTELTGLLADGRSYGSYKVTWDAVNPEDLDEVGKIARVNGTATIKDGETMPVTATIRVAEGETLISQNVAPDCAALTETCDPTSDNLQSIINGNYDGLSSTSERWTNYNSQLLNPSPAITFTWDEAKKLDYVKLFYFTDNYSAYLPEDVKFAVSEDGVTFQEVDVDASEIVSDIGTYTFKTLQTAKALRITLTEQTGHCVGLSECEIFTPAFSYTVNSTAVLDSLKINGRTPLGFVSGEWSEEVYQLETTNGEPVITAEAADNASVTVLPVDQNDVVRILVCSEDQTVQNLYQVQLTRTDSVGSDLEIWIDFMESLNESEYTKESYAALAEALEAAKAVNADPAATRGQIDAARAALLAAFGGLEYGVQKQHLQVAVEAADAILSEADQYTVDSLTALRAVIDEAKAILADEAATQERVNAVTGDLLDAIAQVADYQKADVLRNLIRAAESLMSSKYTEESLAVLREAIADAKEVAAKPDPTDRELADAYRELAEAIRGLEIKGNKAALGSIISKAREILDNESNYVASSILGLPAALEAAQAVYDREDATQSEVSAAAEALTTEVVKARLKGDVDRDGRVTTNDSAEVLKYNAELTDLTGEQLEGADVNGDGTVDTKDAVLILQYASEKISTF